MNPWTHLGPAECELLARAEAVLDWSGLTFCFQFCQKFCWYFQKKSKLLPAQASQGFATVGFFLPEIQPIIDSFSSPRPSKTQNYSCWYFIHRLFQLFQVKVGLGELLECLVCDLKSQWIRESVVGNISAIFSFLWTSGWHNVPTCWIDFYTNCIIWRSFLKKQY